MKEYTLLHGTDAEVASRLNQCVRQGWEPIHFAMAADHNVNRFGILLVREDRKPGTIKGRLGEGRPA
ncbi:hypothetical protein LCGC14_1424470 [marine sediment metagenome]|uniref:DUF1737 domain-containing protein n=1 Tax=marine sediment metagenome TaxID=412755 RepID=A0A0F9KBH8_9ZZZZ